MEEEKLAKIVKILQSAPLKRTNEDVNLLQELTQDIPFFQEYLNQGNKSVHQECCMHMKHRFCHENEIVFEKNSFGDKFYVILSGRAMVLVEGHSPESTIEGMKCVKIMSRGTSFGEVALIKNQPRLATIQCKTECHLATLDKNSFTRILKDLEEDKLLLKTQFFLNMPIFQKWDETQLRMLYLNSFQIKLKKGEYLFKEGEETKSIFIICHGEFTLAVWQQFELVGQEDLVKNIPHQYSVQCSSMEGEVIIINKSEFKLRIMSDSSSKNYIKTNIKLREIWLHERIENAEKIMNDQNLHQFFISDCGQSDSEKPFNSQISSFLQNNKFQKSNSKQETNSSPSKITNAPKHISGTQENKYHKETKQIDNLKYVAQERSCSPIIREDRTNSPNRRLDLNKEEINTTPLRKDSDQNPKTNIKTKETSHHIRFQEPYQLLIPSPQSSPFLGGRDGEQSPIQKDSELSPILKGREWNSLQKPQESSPLLKQKPIGSLNNSFRVSIQQKKAAKRKPKYNKDLVQQIIAAKEKELFGNKQIEEISKLDEEPMKKSKKYVYTRYKSMTNLPYEFGGQAEDSEISSSLKSNEKNISLLKSAHCILQKNEKKNLSEQLLENKATENSMFPFSKSEQYNNVLSPLMIKRTHSHLENTSSPLLLSENKLKISDSRQINERMESKIPKIVLNSKIVKSSLAIKMVCSDNEAKAPEINNSNYKFKELKLNGQKLQTEQPRLRKSEFFTPLKAQSTHLNPENIEKRISESQNSMAFWEEESPSGHIWSSMQRKVKSVNGSIDQKQADSPLKLRVPISQNNEIKLNVNRSSDSSPLRKSIAPLKSKGSEQERELYKFEKEKKSRVSPQKEEQSWKSLTQRDSQQFEEIGNDSSRSSIIYDFLKKALKKNTLIKSSTLTNFKIPCFYNTLKHKSTSNQLKIHSKNNSSNNSFTNISVTNNNINADKSFSNNKISAFQVLKQSYSSHILSSIQSKKDLSQIHSKTENTQTDFHEERNDPEIKQMNKAETNNQNISNLQQPKLIQSQNKKGVIVPQYLIDQGINRNTNSDKAFVSSRVLLKQKDESKRPLRQYTSSSVAEVAELVQSLIKQQNQNINSNETVSKSIRKPKAINKLPSEQSQEIFSDFQQFVNKAQSQDNINSSGNLQEIKILNKEFRTNSQEKNIKLALIGSSQILFSQTKRGYLKNKQ